MSTRASGCIGLCDRTMCGAAEGKSAEEHGSCQYSGFTFAPIWWNLFLRCLNFTQMNKKDKNECKPPATLLNCSEDTINHLSTHRDFFFLHFPFVSLHFTRCHTGWCLLPWLQHTQNIETSPSLRPWFSHLLHDIDGDVEQLGVW